MKIIINNLSLIEEKMFVIASVGEDSFINVSLKEMDSFKIMDEAQRFWKRNISPCTRKWTDEHYV